jgi:ADP-heptose:LPS heptosyltransferase
MSDLAVVFQIGSLGDSIVSVPTLLSLKQLLPSVSDYVLITKIESKLKISVNEVFDMAWKAKGQITFQRAGTALDRFTSVAGLIAKLRYYRPRYCVYLAPAERAQRHVKRDEIFFRAGGAKELIGFRAFTHEELSVGRTPALHNSEAYLRFSRVWNRPAEQEFRRFAATPIFDTDLKVRKTVQSWLKAERRYPERRLVALAPYSNWSSRNLPSQAIIELLSRLDKELNLEVVLAGGTKDVEEARAAVRAAGTGLNACGIFSVGESAALLQSCRLAICTESGPMHLACALGVPSVIAFSRTNKHLGRWFPLGNRYTILYREPECAGCDSASCLTSGHPCLSGITVNQILAAAVSRLNGLALAPAMQDGTRALASDGGELICKN